MSHSMKTIVKYAFFSPTLGISFQTQNQDLILVDTHGNYENSATLIEQYSISSNQSDDDEESEPTAAANDGVSSPKKVRVRIIYQ
jgi:hypothetical protein